MGRTMTPIRVFLDEDTYRRLQERGWETHRPPADEAARIITKALKAADRQRPAEARST